MIYFIQSIIEEIQCRRKRERKFSPCISDKNTFKKVGFASGNASKNRFASLGSIYFYRVIEQSANDFHVLNKDDMVLFLLVVMLLDLYIKHFNIPFDVGHLGSILSICKTVFKIILNLLRRAIF